MKTGTMYRTVFGPEFPGHNGQVYADELESMSVPQRAKAFRARMDDYFKKQVGRFASPELAAHFPLVVMTCVGVETVGAYKYGDLRRQKGNSAQEGVRDRHFQLLVEDMDSQFKDLALAPDGSTRPLSDFIYEGFRHPLVHGFYGKWVFITAQTEETDSWFYDSAEKSVLLNVYWFYMRFCKIYEEYFQALIKCPDPSTEPSRTFQETFNKYFSRWM